MMSLILWMGNTNLSRLHDINPSCQRHTLCLFITAAASGLLLLTHSSLALWHKKNSFDSLYCTSNCYWNIMDPKWETKYSEEFPRWLPFCWYININFSQSMWPILRIFNTAILSRNIIISTKSIPQQNLETNSFFECHIKITFHSEYIVLDTRGCQEYSNHTFRLFKRADFFFKLWRVAMNECIENTRSHRILKGKNNWYK